MQERLITWALGSSRWTFLTPAVHSGGAQACAAVVGLTEANAAAPTAELWCWPHDASGAVSLERGALKVQLPAGSIHTLQAVGPSSGTKCVQYPALAAVFRNAGFCGSSVGLLYDVGRILLAYVCCCVRRCRISGGYLREG